MEINPNVRYPDQTEDAICSPAKHEAHRDKDETR